MFQILKIHDNFSLGSILGPKVIVGTLSHWSENSKFQSASFWTKFQRRVIYVYYGHDMGLFS